MVQLLLDHGAEIDNKFNSTHYELSPLHYAAENGICTKIVLIYFNISQSCKPYIWFECVNKPNWTERPDKWFVCENGSDNAKFRIGNSSCKPFSERFARYGLLWPTETDSVKPF